MKNLAYLNSRGPRPWYHFCEGKSMTGSRDPGDPVWIRPCKDHTLYWCTHMLTFVELKRIHGVS